MSSSNSRSYGPSQKGPSGLSTAWDAQKKAKLTPSKVEMGLQILNLYMLRSMQGYQTSVKFSPKEQDTV